MHAYLIVGNDSEKRRAKSEELTKKLKVKTLEFPLAKIEDIRNLNSFTDLTVTSPTAVIINSIEEATAEALNAFLKNLEEPQPDLYYILTAGSIHQLLPTIVSRCQVIKIPDTRYQILDTKIEDFLGMSVGEKLAFADQIRDRKEAKSFVRDLIFFLHENLHEKGQNLGQTATNLELAQKTFNNLKANGNVGLQLTNLVINLH